MYCMHSLCETDQRKKQGYVVGTSAQARGYTLTAFVSFTARSPQLQWGGSLYLGYMRPIETSSVTCGERDREREEREERIGMREGERERESLNI